MAVDQGHATAHLTLGIMYENGQGIQQSYNKACELFKLAAIREWSQPNLM